jgi:hypothetical protein
MTPRSTPRPRHARHADEGEQELDAAELPEQTETLEVNQVESGGDEHGAECRDGEIGQTVAEEDHGGRQCRRRDEAGNLGLAANGIVHGGAGIGAGDRKAPEQARCDVRRAEADQFAIGIDGIAVLQAEAARGHDAAAEADEQDAQRRERKTRMPIPAGWEGQRQGGPGEWPHQMYAQTPKIEGQGQ